MYKDMILNTISYTNLYYFPKYLLIFPKHLITKKLHLSKENYFAFKKCLLIKNDNYCISTNMYNSFLFLTKKIKILCQNTHFWKNVTFFDNRRLYLKG